MNFYIAGLTLPQSHDVLSVEGKVAKIVAILQLILQDAKQICVDMKDMTVIVVMHGCALTPLSLTFEDKQKLLGLLLDAIKELGNNIIFMPGSFSTFETIVNGERLKSKNAKMLTSEVSVQSEPCLKRHNYLFKPRSTPQLGTTLLQNCAYIITSQQKIKRKKAIPFSENNFLPDQTLETIFYTGINDTVKMINVGHEQMQIALNICNEHGALKPAKKEEQTPLLHVILSNSIVLNCAHLIGALNIQMDSVDELIVIRNSSHPKADEICLVEAACYNTACLKERTSKVEVTTKELQPPEASPEPNLRGFIPSRRQEALPTVAWPKRSNTK